MAVRMTHSCRDGTRQRLRTTLLVFSNLLAFLTFVGQVLILIAGSWVVRNYDGSKHLVLSDLSILRFEGIVPSSSEPDSYLVTMHHFIASFGYEYPSASAAGVIFFEPDLPNSFVTIGRQLSVPSSSWDCFRGGGACTSPFYRAFRNDELSIPTELALVTQLYAVLYIATVFVVEFLIVVRPSWLRCQCYFSFLKRICPCPRGSRAEIEALPSGFWDRYRMWMWFLFPCTVLLSASELVINGALLKSFVSRPGAGNVNARLGTGFLTVEGLSICTSFWAAGCVYARRALGRKTTWLEQQGAVVADEAMDKASEGEAARNKEYSDAEPDAPLSPAQVVVEEQPQRLA